MAPPLTGSSLILHPPTGGYGYMKRILCSLLVATLPFGSVLADAPKSKNAKVALQASWWQEHGAAHAGGPRAQQAGNWKHGHFSREAKAERSRLRAAILVLRDLRDSI
jgi:hypothetical protein